MPSKHVQPANTGLPRKARYVFRVLWIAGGVLAGLTATLFFLMQESAEEYTRRAESRMLKGEFAAALELAEQAIQLKPDSVAARMFAADAASQIQQFEVALRHAVEIPDESPVFGLDGRLLTASLYFQQGDDLSAERHLLRALQIDSGCVAAHRLMALSLSRHGRRWESIKHLLIVLQTAQATLYELRLLAAPEAVLTAPSPAKSANEQTSDSAAYASLQAACVMIAEDRMQGAEERLQDCLRIMPDLMEAQLRYGQLLVDQARFEELAEWHNALPESAAEFPETWIIRAQWSDRKDLPQAALDCLTRALLMHPHHSVAHYQIGQALTRLGRAADARPFLDRSQQLRDVMRLAGAVVAAPNRVEPQVIQQLIQKLQHLQRSAEALAWLQLLQHRLQDTWIRAARSSLRKELLQVDSWTTASALLHDISAPSQDVWTPPLTKSSARRQTDHPSTDQQHGSIRFANVASASGLHFRYHNGMTDNAPHQRMYGVTGGGVGCLDFDGDEWPDLYFSQAGPVAPYSVQGLVSGKLYRNQRGTSMRDCTADAGFFDNRFGQGVAAGDVNNDGFTDLYVANIDGNQLWTNNGDGTFSDASHLILTPHAYWTTSCAIADLNQDSIPDLYDVTYVDGPDILTKTCLRDGIAESCSPTLFKSAPNVLQLGDGLGSFSAESQKLTLDAADGNGLGLVIGAFGKAAEIRVFVANDGRANFYFRPPDSGRKQPPHNPTALYLEEAQQRGLAFDLKGRPQACMGIAQADFNGDLLADFHVTNFFIEANALYLQTPGELFRDESRALGLYENSIRFLGFGTQAIDADADGWPDLIVANGHINAKPADGATYRMRPQFFRNMQGKAFEELSADFCGEYFARPVIGRSLAVLDWNRDGRSEVAVSQIQDEAVLLENQTTNRARSLTVRLVGKNCSRDAVGARVIVDTDTRSLLQLVTAGDGYQCSNEKRLHFGLGTSARILRIKVAWPNGNTNVFEGTPADLSLTIREGDRQLWSRP